ncbi:MAG: hypothetical protein HYR88_10310 [Verrucomicrobia bacterium]|nr:hypothetical protein [Verrucomicrobiota bacterium]MBI3867493.1 hypothetical protein [Verrucomicrobiota bacterium]
MNRLIQHSRELLLVALAVVAGCKPGPASKPSEPRITGSPSEPPVEMPVRWRDQHLYDITLQLEQYTQVRNRNTDEDFDQDIKFRVEFNGAVETKDASKPEGNLWLNLDVTGLMFTLFRGDVPLVHYDTRTKMGLLEDDQRTTEALEKLLGARWRYGVSPDGSVLAANIDTNSPSARALSPDIKIMGVSLVRRLFSPYYFRPFLEFNTLPSSPVKVGASWPVERLLNAGTVGTVQFKGTYTFRGWQQHLGRRCARVDMAGELKEATRSGGRGRILGGTSQLEKGTLSGQIWYDPEQKIPLQMITDLNMMTVVNMRSKRPKDMMDTNSPTASISNAPVTRLSVPLTQRINLKIADIGAPPAASGPAPVEKKESAPR